MPIYIRYDPHDGKAVPDAKADIEADDMIQCARLQADIGSFPDNPEFSFSTENVLIAIRAMIAERLLSDGRIVFRFGNHETECDRKGQYINPPPRRITPDHTDGWIGRLLRAQKDR